MNRHISLNPAVKPGSSNKLNFCKSRRSTCSEAVMPSQHISISHNSDKINEKVGGSNPYGTGPSKQCSRSRSSSRDRLERYSRDTSRGRYETPGSRRDKEPKFGDFNFQIKTVQGLSNTRSKQNYSRSLSPGLTGRNASGFDKSNSEREVTHLKHTGSNGVQIIRTKQGSAARAPPRRVSQNDAPTPVRQDSVGRQRQGRTTVTRAQNGNDSRGRRSKSADGLSYADFGSSVQGYTKAAGGSKSKGRSSVYSAPMAEKRRSTVPDTHRRASDGAPRLKPQASQNGNNTGRPRSNSAYSDDGLKYTDFGGTSQGRPKALNAFTKKGTSSGRPLSMTVEQKSTGSVSFRRASDGVPRLKPQTFQNPNNTGRPRSNSTCSDDSLPYTDYVIPMTGEQKSARMPPRKVSSSCQVSQNGNIPRLQKSNSAYSDDGMNYSGFGSSTKRLPVSQVSGYQKATGGGAKVGTNRVAPMTVKQKQIGTMPPRRVSQDNMRMNQVSQNATIRRARSVCSDDGLLYLEKHYQNQTSLENRTNPMTVNQQTVALDRLRRGGSDRQLQDRAIATTLQSRHNNRPDAVNCGLLCDFDSSPDSDLSDSDSETSRKYASARELRKIQQNWEEQSKASAGHQSVHDDSSNNDIVPALFEIFGGGNDDENEASKYRYSSGKQEERDMMASVCVSSVSTLTVEQQPKRRKSGDFLGALAKMVRRKSNSVADKRHNSKDGLIVGFGERRKSRDELSFDELQGSGRSDYSDLDDILRESTALRHFCQKECKTSGK